jgi:hypothetical protein
MTVEEKLWELVQRLLKKTDANSVSWETTPNKNTFQTAFPRFTVRISEKCPEVGDPDYYIAIYDERGRVIEQASDVDLRRSLFPHQEGTGDVFKTMRELYGKARRIALGVDTALDDLLGSLDES